MNDFYSNVAVEPDDYNIHAVQLAVSNSWTMDGPDVCRGNYPEDYSIIVKFKLRDLTKLKSLTLLNISNEQHGLAITLDNCNNLLNITLGSNCPHSMQSFNLNGKFNTSKEWLRIGLSFSADALGIYIDTKACSSSKDEDEEVPQLLNYQQLDLSQCQVRPCDEGTKINVMQTAQSSSCSSEGLVSAVVMIGR